MKPKETEEGEITTMYARALEDNIRLQPELWLWTHNRWKWKRIEN
jgi:KDO2-lipid IV(A) lauroyltransferase